VSSGAVSTQANVMCSPMALNAAMGNVPPLSACDGPCHATRAVRVLLVNTNRITPPIAPLALDYIGAALCAEGHEVVLLDLCWAEDAPAHVADAFASSQIDVAAVTFRNTDDCYFASGCSFVPVLRQDVALIREHFEGPVVLGGGGFSLMPVRLLEDVGVPYGVRGDGEAGLAALLRALNGDFPLSRVPGLVYREEGRWQLNAPAQANLTKLSLAPRNVVDNLRYFTKGGQAGIETKRGCASQCIYCADPVIKGRKVRTRPAADVVAEIRSLLARGVDYLHFCDSEFNLPEAHAADVCQAIADGGLGDRVRWYTYASPVPFSRHLAMLMKRAGCVGINFGADSGSDRMLAALGRNFRAADIGETVEVCREAGIPVMLDLLLGAPGETWDTVAETIDLMKAISPDCVGVSLGVRVYPGTPLEARLARTGKESRGLIGDLSGTEPAFYLSPALDDEPYARIRSMVEGDERFFLPFGGDERDYNYNDNTVLRNAIEAGARGAYWDILRKMRGGR
jgi:tryptophan 2-C-methyltransferase